MINYGIVGTGYFGADLARSLEKIKDAKVTAVFDPENGEKVAKELEAENCSTLEQLVTREDVDCVIVATPSNLHREPVLLAAKNGKH
ncbi:Gfo/Idh/MocA family protein, partial [Gemella sp.]